MRKQLLNQITRHERSSAAASPASASPLSASELCSPASSPLPLLLDGPEDGGASLLDKPEDDGDSWLGTY